MKVPIEGQGEPTNCWWYVVIQNTLVGEWVGLQILMQLGTNSSLKCSSGTSHAGFIRHFYDILAAKSRFVPAGGMCLDN